MGIMITTSALARNEVVGIGVAVRDNVRCGRDKKTTTFSTTLGPGVELSPFYAELEAVVRGLKSLPDTTVSRTVTVWTSNRMVLSTIHHPGQQSGQHNTQKIRQEIQRLKVNNNKVILRWLPAGAKVDLMRRAKAEARSATEQNAIPDAPYDQARTTVKNSIISEQQIQREIPKGVGEYSKKVDMALPGKHTRILYDNLKRNEARILAQLRTGMARINGYLHQIGAAETEACACGQARETIKHFLFHCLQWQTQRRKLLEHRESKIDNLPFFLGGKGPADQDDWIPDMKAVRATIKYALATGRLDYEPKTG